MGNDPLFWQWGHVGGSDLSRWESLGSLDGPSTCSGPR